jgi:hypothetical protein
MVGEIGEDLSNYLYLRLLRPKKSSSNLPLSGEEDSEDSTDPGAFRADFGGIFALAEEDWRKIRGKIPTMVLDFPRGETDQP